VKKSYLALVLILLFLSPGLSWAWSGKVVGVIDGDSITVLHDGRQEKIRLWGIDRPEKHQDFGTKAKQATSALVFAKVVKVEPVTTDRYSRTVAFVRVGNTLVNEQLIRQGFAWVFTRYCDRPICQGWKAPEEEARKARRGLWSMPKPVAPALRLYDSPGKGRPQARREQCVGSRSPIVGQECHLPGPPPAAQAATDEQLPPSPGGAL
jgi:micrococcal nuclease